MVILYESRFMLANHFNIVHDFGCMTYVERNKLYLSRMLMYALYFFVTELLSVV